MSSTRAQTGQPRASLAPLDALAILHRERVMPAPFFIDPMRTRRNLLPFLLWRSKNRAYKHKLSECKSRLKRHESAYLTSCAPFFLAFKAVQSEEDFVCCCSSR